MRPGVFPACLCICSTAIRARPCANAYSANWRPAPGPSPPRPAWWRVPGRPCFCPCPLWARWCWTKNTTLPSNRTKACTTRRRKWPGAGLRGTRPCWCWARPRPTSKPFMPPGEDCFPWPSCLGGWAGGRCPAWNWWTSATTAATRPWLRPPWRPCATP